MNALTKLIEQLPRGSAESLSEFIEDVEPSAAPKSTAVAMGQRLVADGLAVDTEEYYDELLQLAWELLL